MYVFKLNYMYKYRLYLLT